MIVWKVRLFSEITFLQSETYVAGEFQLTVNYPEHDTTEFMQTSGLSWNSIISNKECYWN